MTIVFLDSKKIEKLRNALNNDAELKIATKFMQENILLEVDDYRCLLKVRDCVVTEIKMAVLNNDPWSFSIKASADTWEKLLQPTPPPFFTGLNAGLIRGNIQILGNIEMAFAYFWSMNRIIDIMRELQNE